MEEEGREGVGARTLGALGAGFGRLGRAADTQRMLAAATFSPGPGHRELDVPGMPLPRQVLVVLHDISRDHLADRAAVKARHIAVAVICIYVNWRRDLPVP